MPEEALEESCGFANIAQSSQRVNEPERAGEEGALRARLAVSGVVPEDEGSRRELRADGGPCSSFPGATAARSDSAAWIKAAWVSP